MSIEIKNIPCPLFFRFVQHWSSGTHVLHLSLTHSDQTCLCNPVVFIDICTLFLINPQIQVRSPVSAMISCQTFIKIQMEKVLGTNVMLCYHASMVYQINKDMLLEFVETYIA